MNVFQNINYDISASYYQYVIVFAYLWVKHSTEANKIN